MKHVLFFVTLLAATFSVIASDLDAIQGRWTVTKTGDSGPRMQTLEFKKDKFTFKVASGGDTRFVADGEVEVKKAGAFHTLRLHKIKYGSSESDLQEAEEERHLVFLLRDDQLYLASNLDRSRENEKPALDAYSKSTGSADAATSITGTWKLTLTVADNDLDYTLRIVESDGKLAATVTSPRSGTEYKAKKATFEKDTLTMEVDREIDGNPVTFTYTGKLKGDASLSGNVALKSGSNEMSGTWTAKKQ